MYAALFLALALTGCAAPGFHIVAGEGPPSTVLETLWASYVLYGNQGPIPLPCVEVYYEDSRYVELPVEPLDGGGRIRPAYAVDGREIHIGAGDRPELDILRLLIHELGHIYGVHAGFGTTPHHDGPVWESDDAIANRVSCVNLGVPEGWSGRRRKCVEE